MPSAVAKTATKTAARKKKEIPEEALVPPNHDYIKLTISKVTATYKTASGKNETLTMESLGDGNFLVTEGDTGLRWNNKAKKHRYPMSMWDEFYASRIRCGWLLYDTQKRDKVNVSSSGVRMNGQEYQPIPDKGAAQIVERLVGYANQMIEEEYSRTIADVPDWAFEEAKKTLDLLAKHYETIGNAQFNRGLTHLFEVLPRRIDVMAKYIAAPDAGADDRAKIIEEERDRYDVLYSMLRGGKPGSKAGQTILDAYGISLTPFTEEETETAKKLLRAQADKLVRGWRVTNHKTQDAFERFCQQEHLTEGHGIDTLFHGSKHQNWWSILTGGLTINPIGVAITGKAYGYGTYFAPDAIKSLGYTDRIGAKYTSGGQSTGFMGIYKVATGNRYDGRNGCDSGLNWEKLQKIQPGAHCTWAEWRYSGFMMDEVIVYKDEQSTVWGLLELAC